MVSLDEFRMLGKSRALCVELSSRVFVLFEGRKRAIRAAFRLQTVHCKVLS